jgi:hypothetical protein
MPSLLIWKITMPKTLFYIFIVLLLIGSCANERAITGGPEDKEAPEVIYSNPVNESVQVDRETDILLRFSEQMEQKSFKAALEIWPRPPGGYEIRSSWKWLKVTFNDALDSNETYLLTLDKSAKDLRGNGLSKTYVMAFSTGSELNSGRIVGRIYGSEDIRKNGQLFLYRTFDTDLDELRKEPPDYIFQPDNEGNFELPYLSQRSYMLFHHWDRNRNKQIDGGDYFGRPVSASVMARSDSLLTDHNIWPRLVKPEKVKMLKAGALASNLIQIRVNRPVTKAALAALEIHTELAQIPILGANTVSDDEFAMVFETGMPIRHADAIWLRKFTDTSGYSLHSDTLTFNIPDAMDTLLWEAPEVGWFSGEALLMPGDSQAVRIGSNLPALFSTDSAFQIMEVAGDSIPLTGNLVKRNSLEWLFLPDSALKLGHSYHWQILTQLVKVPLDSSTPDSLITGQLKTLTPDSLGSIRLTQMSSSRLHCELSGPKLIRNFILSPGTETLLDHLPARNYVLSAFVDKNGDGRYNSGGLGPAAGAEPFWFFSDEIKVRARWETDLGYWSLRTK